MQVLLLRPLKKHCNSYHVLPDASFLFWFVSLPYLHTPQFQDLHSFSFKNPFGFLSIRIRPFYCLRWLTEQSPHALVPRFRERKHIFSLATGIFSRTKAKITYELSCRRKSCKIMDLHDCFHSCSYINTWETHKLINLILYNFKSSNFRFQDMFSRFSAGKKEVPVLLF